MRCALSSFKKNKLSSAYTLIEILVAVTIIGLIFSIGYAGFREYSRRQAVISLARTIRSDIRLAQQNAIAGKKPDGCSGDLDAYDVRFAPDATYYTVEAICGGLPTEIKTVEVPPGLEITNPTTNPISFYSVARGTNIVGNNALIAVNRADSGSYQQVIEVGAAGEVK